MAAYLRIDPLVLRVLIVVLAIFGGSGIVLYLAGWLLMPDEGEAHSEVDRIIGRDPTRGPSLAGVAGAVLVAVLLAGSLGLGVVIDNHGWGGPNLWPLIVVAGIVAVIWYVRREPGSRSTAAPGAPTYPGTGDWGAPRPGPGAGAGPTWPGAGGWNPPGPTPPGPTPQGAPADPFTSTGPHPGAAAAAPGPATTLIDLPGAAGAAPPSWPGTTGADPVRVPPPARRPRSVLGPLTWWVVLLAAGVMLLVTHAGSVHVHPVTFFAVLLAILGAGLVLGAFAGRSRGLIVAGIGMSAITALVGALPSVGHGQTGRVSWAPTSVTAVPVDGYTLAAGKGTLDLTRLPTGSTGHQVQAEVGAGRLVVLVPPGLSVSVHASVGLGSIVLPDGRRLDGISRAVDAVFGPAPGVGAQQPLEVRLDVGAGTLEVLNAQA